MKALVVIFLAAVLAGSIFLQARPSYQVSSLGFGGDISMVQGRFGNPLRPNFEAIIPMAENGFVHLWRNNGLKAHFHWNNYQVQREEVGHIDAVSLVEGPMGPKPGNLEFLARIGDRVAHFWRETGSGPWQGPAWLPGSGYSGTPSIAMACYDEIVDCGKNTFEVLIPSADKGFVFMGRINYEAGHPDSDLVWQNVKTYGQEVGHIDAISVLQGRYGHDGNNLEAVARVGDRLAHFYRESGQLDWKFESWLPGSGYAGNPSLVQGTLGDKNRNMELAVPMKDGGFAYIWRNGDVDGLPWSEPRILGKEFSKIDSVALIESTFGENHDNLELIARVGDKLASTWRDSAHVTGPNGGWKGLEYLDLFYSGTRPDTSPVDIDLPQSELRKVRVTFQSVYAHESHDQVGEGHWDLMGAVNGKPIELMNDYLVPADVPLNLNTRPDTPKTVDVIFPKAKFFTIEANGRERDKTPDGGQKSAFTTVLQKGEGALNSYLSEKYKSKLDEKQLKELSKAEKDLAIWNDLSKELKSNDNTWVNLLGTTGHAGLQTYAIFSSAGIPAWGQVALATFALADFIDEVADLNPDDGLGAIKITCAPINNFCLGTHTETSQHNGHDDDSVNDYDLTFKVEELAFTPDDFKGTPANSGETTKTMTVQVAGNPVNIEVKSASTISNFRLDEEKKSISFHADDGSNTGAGSGSTILQIGKILEGDYLVTVDGQPTTDFQVPPKGSTTPEDSKMKISFAHGAHDIDIIGTRVVPEFPPAIIAIAIAMAAAVGFTSKLGYRFGGQKP